LGQSLGRDDEILIRKRDNEFPMFDFNYGVDGN